ncbi:MAG: hypothetical protein ABDH20_07980 [Thermus sp.]
MRVVLDPEKEMEAVSGLCLMKLFHPEIRVEPDGSMFTLSRACRFLQAAGFPVDPWFVTGRELYTASSRAIGDRRPYLVEVRPEEIRMGRAEGFPWLKLLEAHRGGLPQGASPVGTFPGNRVWRLPP